MLPIESADVRLFLHVLAASIWVGGQLTLAGLVPVLRPFDREVTLAAARRFNVVAWSAMLVLVITGVWNLFEVEAQFDDSEYLVTLFAKLGAVAATAAGALLHIVSKAPVGLAVGGALSSLGGLAALFLGIVLH